jgi:hypothetical protein
MFHRYSIRSYYDYYTPNIAENLVPVKHFLPRLPGCIDTRSVHQTTNGKTIILRVAGPENVVKVVIQVTQPDTA